jgi:histidinol-phosphate aminotransferase
VTGRPRSAVDGLPAYRPGKGAAQAEAEHGIVDAIKLASNETPWGPVPSVVAAIEAAAGDVNRYADHRATMLRERLASRLGVDVDMVTAGCGSVGLLQQLCLTYVDPGDEVVYPWRSFEVYPVYTQLVGGVAVTPPLVDDRFDLGAVADAVNERTKLVVLATPNNPTGTSVSTDELAAMLDRIDERTVVVIDEAYREFNDPAFGDPVVDLVPRYANVIVLRTFSKAQGLAALRVGYGVAHPEVIEAVDKTLFPFAVNGLAQVAALAAIEAEDEIMQRVEVLRAERTRVVEALRVAGVELPDPQANFVWLPVGARTDDLYLELERRGVVTRPFSGEGIRVTIGTPGENDRFLATLAEVI